MPNKCMCDFAAISAHDEFSCRYVKPAARHTQSFTTQEKEKRRANICVIDRRALRNGRNYMTTSIVIQYDAFPSCIELQYVRSF